jgi:hypothetical protein
MTMPRCKCRAFDRFDALILVTATLAVYAVWPALLNLNAPPHPLAARKARFVLFPYGLDSLIDVLKSLEACAGRPRAYILAWTAALIAIRFRHPRAPLRRVARQPGLAACLAVSVVSLIGAIRQAMLACLYWSETPGARWIDPLRSILGFQWSEQSAGPTGLAVGAVWLLLRLSRRWRPEPGWIDRAGIIVGVYWIVGVPLSWFLDA